MLIPRDDEEHEGADLFTPDERGAATVVGTHAYYLRRTENGGYELGCEGDDGNEPQVTPVFEEWETLEALLRDWPAIIAVELPRCGCSSLGFIERGEGEFTWSRNGRWCDECRRTHVIEVTDAEGHVVERQCEGPLTRQDYVDAAYTLVGDQERLVSMGRGAVIRLNTDTRSVYLDEIEEYEKCPVCEGALPLRDDDILFNVYDCGWSRTCECSVGSSAEEPKTDRFDRILRDCEP